MIGWGTEQMHLGMIEEGYTQSWERGATIGLMEARRDIALVSTRVAALFAGILSSRVTRYEPSRETEHLLSGGFLLRLTILLLSGHLLSVKPNHSKPGA